jgi:uncharacterized protein YdcH (DUF465 family)
MAGRCIKLYDSQRVKLGGGVFTRFSNRLFVCFLIGLAVVISTPVFADSADYQVVIKKTGKIIAGELVSDEGSTIVLKTNGVKVSFQKSTLDLDRMKELNANTTRGKFKQIDFNNTPPSEAPPGNNQDLAKVAVETKEKRTGTSKTYKQSDSAGASSSTSASTDRSKLIDQINELRKKVAELEGNSNQTGSSEEVQNLRQQLQQKEAMLSDVEKREDRDERIADINRQIDDFKLRIAKAKENNESQAVIQGYQKQLEAARAELSKLLSEKSD